MLLAWAQATKTVLGESKGLRFSGVSFGFLDEEGVHHFMVRNLEAAMRTQEEMLASWSMDERIISECGARDRAWARLAKSWVVEGPITGFVDLC